MADQPESTLVKLGDTDLTLANPADDVRGSTVVDRNGNDVGDVDGLLIDEHEKRVRFLQVGSGGFLGIGEKKRLIPVDAVTAVDEKVHLGATTRDQVAESLEYDPELVVVDLGDVGVVDVTGQERDGARRLAPLALGDLHDHLQDPGEALLERGPVFEVEAASHPLADIGQARPPGPRGHRLVDRLEVVDALGEEEGQRGADEEVVDVAA